jgi:hypothetical protein
MSRVLARKKMKNEAEAGLRALHLKWRSWRGFRLPTIPAGLLTTPALDLDFFECSSHRGLRSIIR